VMIYSGTAGHLDDVPRDRVADFERDLYRYMDVQAPQVGPLILKERKWTDEVEKAVRAMLDEFKKAHPYTEAKPAVKPEVKVDAKAEAKTQAKA